MPPLLKLQKIITGVEGLGTWQPTQRDEPPSNQGWSVQKWLLAVEGRRAWLHRSPPHGRMEKIKKTNEKMEIPPSSLGCTLTLTEWPLWVSPAHGCTRLRHIFRFPSVFLIFCGGLGQTSREACSLSWTAIIISIDGFSVPPSISIPNYAVERSAVANNQINEFGYLDSIIASPSVCPTRTIILYLEIWAQTDGGWILPWGRGSFLLSTERPHITAT